MSNFTCKYHPDRAAVSKCEKCNSFICLECKNIYRSQHSHHVSDGHHHSYTTTYELCPICYAEKVNTTTNPICYIFPVIFIVFFIIIGMGPSVGFQAIFFIVPIIMLGVLDYYCLIRGSQIRQEAERRKESALRSMQFNPPSVNRTEVRLDSTRKTSKINCRQCGSLLEPGEKYCSNCGNSTKDEFEG